MNARQLSLILIVAIVLGAVGWIFFHRGVRSWESEALSGHDKVIDFPLNDVAHITIKDGTSELNLMKEPEGWAVRERADYPANFEQVSRLLQKVWNLKPVETVPVGPSQFARLELIEPATGAKSGTLLELKDKDGKRITALLAGKQYFKKSNQSFGPANFPAGRYVMPEDGARKVVLISDPMQDLVTKPERWLDHGFIKIEKPKTVALVGTSSALQWKIQREAAESANWKFAEAKPGEEVDQTKVSGLASTLSNLSFVDVLDPKATLESTGLDKPSTATIETFDGITYSLKIGNPEGDKYPVTLAITPALASQREPVPNEKAEDKKKLDDEFAAQKKKLEEKLAKEKKFEGRSFLITKFSIDQLLKNRSDLIKASPTPSASPGASPFQPPLPRPAPNDKRAGKALHTPAPPARP